jgi:hypothetical protein
MPLDDPAALAAKSDAELAALARDRSLSAEDWAAVEREQARRAAQRRAGASGGGASGAGAGGAGAGAGGAGRNSSAASPGPARPAAAAASEAGDWNLDEALNQLRAVLVPGETLEAYAVQRRLYALTHRRVIVAATSGRFVALSRGLFGGYTLSDVRWQDLRDANLRAGIFGADLTITSLQSEDLATSEGPGRSAVYYGLRKEQAQSVYRLCQAQEQAWREKRRVRDLDEMRARSGGIHLGTSGPPPMGSVGFASGETPAIRLSRAKEMLDAGLITDAEYESIKARVIDGL